MDWSAYPHNARMTWVPVRGPLARMFDLRTGGPRTRILPMTWEPVRVGAVAMVS